MKVLRLLFLCLAIHASLFAQTAFQNKMNTAWRSFSNDAQLDYGMAGICVMDANTGQVLFEKNSRTGLAPASTQKVITTIAAYESLGQNYQYKTRIGYTGKISNKILEGDLVIEGNGDPSLGSDRYNSSSASVFLPAVQQALEKAGIAAIKGNIVGTDKGFDVNPVPDGWIWSDIGNYYGAGHWALNWHENQYDVFVKTGSYENASTKVIETSPATVDMGAIYNDVKSGRPGSGDGSVLYTSPYSNQTLFQGKLEPNKSRFSVSGSMHDGSLQALLNIKNYLAEHGIIISGEPLTKFDQLLKSHQDNSPVNYFFEYNAPSFDSLTYWFLHKSINLYGEAFVRTIGLEKNEFGATEKGLDWINKFYVSKGIDRDALHLYDGSGLSPANRVAPEALVKALYYAKKQSWYPAFYDALPTYNGMKLKSGTINRVKCYAGYHTSRSGEDYIVALMVNNYNGSSSALISKMFKLLDELK